MAVHDPKITMTESCDSSPDLSSDAAAEADALINDDSWSAHLKPSLFMSAEQFQELLMSGEKTYDYLERNRQQIEARLGVAKPLDECEWDCVHLRLQMKVKYRRLKTYTADGRMMITPITKEEGNELFRLVDSRDDARHAIIEAESDEDEQAHSTAKLRELIAQRKIQEFKSELMEKRGLEPPHFEPVKGAACSWERLVPPWRPLIVLPRLILETHSSIKPCKPDQTPIFSPPIFTYGSGGPGGRFNTTDSWFNLARLSLNHNQTPVVNLIDEGSNLELSSSKWTFLNNVGEPVQESDEPEPETQCSSAMTAAAAAEAEPDAVFDSRGCESPGRALRLKLQDM